MKKLLTILLFSLSINVSAGTYYVSATGNDADPGTSTGTAWQTLSKVNGTTFKAGDKILFKRGDTFYGKLLVSQSGTSSNKIIFGAYGSGANPVISGITNISTWTNLGSNIWESTSAVSTFSTCNMVLINGVNTAMGRYPNTGYLTFQSHSGNSITSSSLTGTPNWSGAEAVIRSSQYTLDRSKITSQSSGTLNYATTLSNVPSNNFGFFIQNDARTLDQQNEWYYDPSTKKLRVYSTSSPTNVQIPTIDTLVVMKGNSVNFINLSFQGANSYAFYNNTGGMWDVVIDSCSINFCGIDAIKFENCTRFILSNSTISNSNNSAVNLLTYNPTTTIINNKISNSGIFPGMGRSGFTAYIAVTLNGDDSKISRNKIINSGYSAVNFAGNNITVDKNYIDSFCSVKQDGGGIYIGGNTRLIKDNIVLNGIGAEQGTDDVNKQARGIYLDDNSSNVIVTNNSVFNCSSGLYLHNTFNFTIRNNTFFANGQQLLVTHDSTQTQITGGVLKSNIFFSKLPTQDVGHFYSSNNNVNSWGTLDSNYYARPIDDNLIFFTHLGWGAPDVYINLTSWKLYGQEANSKKSPKTITDVNDLRFEYNTDSVSKTVALPYNYMDVTGATYNGTITLAPYSSAVLIKNGVILNTYYVSNSGNDSNDGLTPATPWKTLAKVNATTFKPGDNILFKRGDTFYGSLSISQSGTSGNPITFGAYGSSAKPIITGFTSVTSWTNLGSNIWESTGAVSTLASLNFVAINGINTPMGRFPNTGFLTYKSHSGTTQFTDNVGLSGSPNWTGAEFAFFINTYVINRSPITAQSGGTLTVTPADGNGVQSDNQRYIIQNDVRTLDVQNEWYYNPSTKKLRIYSTSTPTNTKISTVDTAVYLEGINYITFDNLQFTGQNSTSIEVSNSKHISITNCDFSQQGLDAIDGRWWGNSTGLIIKGCTFSDINNNAIHTQGDHDHAYIAYNTVSNVGNIMGAGRSGDGHSIGIFIGGTKSHVEYNNIDNIGYVGVYFAGDSSVVNNNFVNNVLTLKIDGGGIYTSNGNTYTSNYGRKVYNNIVLNSPNARGIYIDDGSSGVEIYNNTISGTEYGLYLHGNHDIDIHHNTVYNNSGAQVLMVSEIGEEIRNNNFRHNVFVSKDASQIVLLFQTLWDDIPLFGVADSNYYSRPMNDNGIIWTAINGVYSYTQRSLANWKTYSGQDTHSFSSAKSVSDTSDFKFVYNATSSPTTISLPFKYLSPTSTSHNGTITLQPYSSAILMKDGTIINTGGAMKLYGNWQIMNK